MSDPFPHLRQYIDRQNIWCRLRKEPEMSPGRLTPDQAENLFQSLDGDMSPENLCCDGEISIAEANKKAEFYKRVYAELTSLGFEPRERLYCF